MFFPRPRPPQGPGPLRDRASGPTSGTCCAGLVGQLREQLLASTDDPSLRRLFPPAYPDDAERDAGYQVLARDELLEHSSPPSTWSSRASTAATSTRTS